MAESIGQVVSPTTSNADLTTAIVNTEDFDPDDDTSDEEGNDATPTNQDLIPVLFAFKFNKDLIKWLETPTDKVKECHFDRMINLFRRKIKKDLKPYMPIAHYLRVQVMSCFACQHPIIQAYYTNVRDIKLRSKQINKQSDWYHRSCIVSIILCSNRNRNNFLCL